MKKGSVYWLHLAEHTDPFSQGYIGVSTDTKQRFIDHKREALQEKHINPHLQRAIIKHGDKIKCSVLVYNTEEYCIEKEKHLRPVQGIGWNIAEGGGNPPRPYGRSWNKGKTKETDPRLNTVGFTKGHTPWHKGKTVPYCPRPGARGRKPNSGCFQKGNVPWNKRSINTAGTVKIKRKE